MKKKKIPNGGTLYQKTWEKYLHGDPDKIYTPKDSVARVVNRQLIKDALHGKFDPTKIQQTRDSMELKGKIDYFKNKGVLLNNMGQPIPQVKTATMKKGGKVKKAMFGMSAGQQIQTPNKFQQGWNKIGGWQGVAQGANAVGQASQSGQQEGGPSWSQSAVGSFGPWGQIISQFSQGITNATKDYETYGGAFLNTIADPAATFTDKNLKKSDRIIGGFIPEYGALKKLQAKKARKKQQGKLDDLMEQVQDLPDTTKRKYYRPEDQMTDPNDLFPSYGVGTNYLKNGGNLTNPQLITKFDNVNVTDIHDIFKPKSMSTLRTGGKIDKMPNGGKKYMLERPRSIFEEDKNQPPVKFPIDQEKIEGIRHFVDSIRAKPGFKGDVYDEVYHDYLGYTPNDSIKKNNVEIARLFGKYTDQPYYEQDSAKLYNYLSKYEIKKKRMGGNLRQNNMAMGGDLQTHWGGYAEEISENPYLPDGGETVMFKGNSHEEKDGKGRSGIGITFGNKPVEVESGEPAVKLENGGLTVFGNMKVPKNLLPEANGKKFKNYINDLSLKEDKQNKILDKSMKVINETPILDSFDRLKFSSAEAGTIGANMKLKQIASKKQEAANVQNAILETADEFGLQSDSLAEGKIKKAKLGTKIEKATDGTEIRPKTMQEYQALIAEYEAKNYKSDPNYAYHKHRMYKEGVGEVVIVPPAKPGGKITNEEHWQNNLIPMLKKGMSPEGLIKERHMLGTPENIERAKKYYDPKGSTPSEEVFLIPPDYTTKDSFVPKRVDVPFNVKPLEVGSYTEQPKEKFPWMDVFNTALPYFRPNNKLGKPDLSPEYWAMANNQLEPVQAQKYHPLLEQPYDISLQDQLNANQADFNSIQRLTGSNPAAQAALAAQKYQANEGVLGEQFRLNQANKAGVYNRNRGTLNDAQLKNLGILKKQSDEMSLAKSSTKAITQAALSSISDKISKNKLEQAVLNVDQNMYNYRFGPNGRAWNWNPLATFDTQASPQQQEVDSNGNVITNETVVKTDGNGRRQNVWNRQKEVKKNKNGGIVKAFKGY